MHDDDTNARMIMTDTDYFTVTDRAAPGPRNADIKATGLPEVIMYVDEPGARDLVVKLTAWLDKPRLDARKTPTVVASFEDADGVRHFLLRTAYEWGVGDEDDPRTGWYQSENAARRAFADETNTVICESCERFIDRDAAEVVDEDGIYTCADETACSAAHAAKESK